MEHKHIGTRSNFFRVKNIEEFTVWATRFGFEITTDEEIVALSHEKIHPNIRERVGDHWEQLKLKEALPVHLHEDSVAVIFEADKDASYGTARGFAVNAKGRSVEVALDDVFEQAEELGTVDWNVP